MKTPQVEPVGFGWNCYIALFFPYNKSGAEKKKIQEVTDRLVYQAFNIWTFIKVPNYGGKSSANQRYSHILETPETNLSRRSTESSIRVPAVNALGRLGEAEGGIIPSISVPARESESSHVSAPVISGPQPKCKA
ncbi:hypothetical protein INT47_007650 [Mucor saturninus]|uniref:Uncharacterized protein n=1 Tax=Mucor saturninus TaxID=64648 RepID=A0A8H7RBX3_9FUNG|nr:hypothetical protein INT47_007650 [Mucor saturninus]